MALARRVAALLACGVVARRLIERCGYTPLLAPSHKPKSPATNCILSHGLISKWSAHITYFLAAGVESPTSRTFAQTEDKEKREGERHATLAGGGLERICAQFGRLHFNLLETGIEL
jgi:hypothetical protein